MATKKPTPKRKPSAAAAAPADVVTTIDGVQVPAAALAHIHPAIRVFAVETASLRPDPRNARRHPEANLLAIATSLRENRQQPSGVLTFDPATRQVKVGNGRLLVATEERWGLNWRWIAAVPSDLSAAELKRYALQDNRTGELAEWDAAEVDRQLAELAQELVGFDAGLSVAIDADELQALLDGDSVAAHGFVPPKPKRPPPETPAPDPQWLVIVKCRDEAEQAAMIEEMESRGLDCTAPSA